MLVGPGEGFLSGVVAALGLVLEGEDLEVTAGTVAWLSVNDDLLLASWPRGLCLC